MALKRLVAGFLVLALAAGCTIGLALYRYAGWDGVRVALRGGGALWVSVAPDDPRLPPSMRLALQTPAPRALPGSFSWRERAQGFDSGELPVMANGIEADRIFLVRIDPAWFRFEVLNRPSNDRDLVAWMAATRASLIVNGSYFGRDARPSTPTVSGGVQLGPADYEARHGAFVVTDQFTGLRDLSGQDWHQALQGARFGFVSYPMLVRHNGEDAKESPRADRRWLANRSFIGQDSAGRIVIGTTREAFFSLDRLAAFLRAAPLDLTAALNLDGGSVACQAVAIGDYRRSFCGDWETRTDGDVIKLLLPSPLPFAQRRLPNVIAVSRK
jgi:hypothetical protein